MPAESVVHVSYYDVEPYANFRGKCLPTETEWEYVTFWNSDTGQKLVYPRGNNYHENRANLNREIFPPTETSAIPPGVSPHGC